MFTVPHNVIVTSSENLAGIWFLESSNSVVFLLKILILSLSFEKKMDNFVIISLSKQRPNSKWVYTLIDTVYT